MNAASEAAKNPDKVIKTAKDAPLEARLTDFTSLLSLIYQDVTKLAIALKPSNPTFRAALSPGKELAAHADALGSCACSFDKDSHGGTLTREIRWLAEDVLSALDNLLRVYGDDDHFIQSSTSKLTETGTPYLVRTGAVHDAIDRARELPRTNREAVRRRWDGLLGGLHDCKEEVQELIEDDEGSDEEDGTDGTSGYEDGWEELLGGSSNGTSPKASEDEMKRLKHVCTINSPPPLYDTHRRRRHTNCSNSRMHYYDERTQPSWRQARPRLRYQIETSMESLCMQRLC